jgi:hypothetical protein
MDSLKREGAKGRLIKIRVQRSVFIDESNQAHKDQMEVDVLFQFGFSFVRKLYALDCKPHKY